MAQLWTTARCGTRAAIVARSLIRPGAHYSFPRLLASMATGVKHHQPTSTISMRLATMSTNAPQSYADSYIRAVLRETKTIAIVGASANTKRPSYFAMSYLQRKGYRCIPVNPGAAAKGLAILGEPVYSSVADIPAEIKIDMVDAFRAAKDAPSIAADAAARGARTLWLQLGVVSDEAKEIAEAGGLRVVMDRCPKIEYSRLCGELGWHGFSSGVLSSKMKSSRKANAGEDSSPPTIPSDMAGFETLAIHAGSRPDPTTGARSTPIYQTTSYVFEDCETASSRFDLSNFGNVYSRLTNPTTAVLEERIATLEKGRGATATASGHAAQLLTLFTLMQPGDLIVASNKLYGGSITQFDKTIKKFQWRCEFVDVDDIASVRAAVANPDCKILWAESLANPGGVISDLEALAQVAHENSVPFVVDNTMATPYLCRPIEHGADLVVHSTTKFMSGHGNAMGGAVVDSGTFDWVANDPSGTKFPSLTQPEPAYHGITFGESFGDLAFTTFGHAVGLRDLGATMAPQNAWLTIMGCETLSLRMDRHCANAQRVAEFLNDHPMVAWVSYAGLPSSKYHDLHKKYMPLGAGSVFTFGVKGGYDAGVKCVEGVTLFSLLANIGDTRSLILHPASTTHSQLTPDQREACGAGDDVIRVSIGIESVEDIIADLDRALSKLD